MARPNRPIIAALLLLATASAVRSESGAKTGSAASADCNRVYKAKAEAGKELSTKQLARDLKLPVATVNKCLKHIRRTGPRSTPGATQ
jgi:hypothetical protein